MTFSGIIFSQSVCTTAGYTFAKYEMSDILHVRNVRKYFRWSETKLPPEEADLTPQEAEMPPVQRRI